METLNLIPAPLSGQEFLAASHLQIGYDNRFCSRKSTFHNDYTPPANLDKQDSAKPPLPARFMHKDDKISSRVSETRQAFPVRKRLEAGDPRDKYSALYKTNFKPDRDDRITIFTTSHDHYYTAKPATVPPDNSKLARTWAKSSFPQGDKEKADKPESTYRGGFKGHDTSKIEMIRKDSQHWGGEPTIKGDDARRFNTTHDTTFTGRWTNPSEPVPKHTWSSIPEGGVKSFLCTDDNKLLRKTGSLDLCGYGLIGDKEKVTEKMSTMRKSFTPYQTEYSPQSHDESYGKLYATNFKLSDGHGRFDQYLSTAKESYTAITSNDKKFKRLRDRNASDIPEGDMDPYRCTARVNNTTTRSHLRNLKTDPVDHVDGSKLRTRSNIVLGEPRLAGRFYDSTCDSTYLAQNVPYKKAQTYYPSIVPLSYYGNQERHSTTWGDFQNPKIGRLHVKDEALENLRKTHFTPPLGGKRFFSTTHDSHYTPKSVVKHDVDQGLLQRTSVPFGTLGQFIPGCHNGWD